MNQYDLHYLNCRDDSCLIIPCRERKEYELNLGKLRAQLEGMDAFKLACTKIGMFFNNQCSPIRHATRVIEEQNAYNEPLVTAMRKADGILMNGLNENYVQEARDVLQGAMYK